jgi:hypothetical protein
MKLKNLSDRIFILLFCILISALALNEELFASQTLYGYQPDSAFDYGNLYAVDAQTGAGYFVGFTAPFNAFDSGISNPYGVLFNGLSPSSSVFEFNPITGNWQSVCDQCLSIFPLSFAYDGVNLYCVDMYGYLYNINPSNWISTKIGNPSVTSIEYYNGILYGVGDDAGGLYKIDTVNGAATLIGFGKYSDISSITVVDGIMYGRSGSKYFKIDMNTGKHTLINNTIKYGLLAATPPAAVVPIESDLIIASFSNPPVSKKPNRIFMVKDVVKNQGTADAGQFTTGYYLSIDNVKSEDDIFLSGNRTISFLGIGISSDENGVKPVKVTIPTNTPHGRYYVIACADNMNEIAESDETNNCKVSRNKIRVLK